MYVAILCSIVSTVHRTCNRNRACRTPWTFLAVGKPVFQDRHNVTPLFTPAPHSSTLQSVLARFVTRSMQQAHPVTIVTGRLFGARHVSHENAPEPPHNVRSTPLRTAYIHCFAYALNFLKPLHLAALRHLWVIHVGADSRKDFGTTIHTSGPIYPKIIASASY